MTFFQKLKHFIYTAIGALCPSWTVNSSKILGEDFILMIFCFVLQKKLLRNLLGGCLGLSCIA